MPWAHDREVPRVECCDPLLTESFGERHEARIHNAKPNVLVLALKLPTASQVSVGRMLRSVDAWE